MHYLQEKFELALRGDAEGVLFWVALYFLVTLLYSLLFQIRVSHWPCTKGTLFSNDIVKWAGKDWKKSDQLYKLSVRYSYHIAGTQFDGTRVSPWHILASYNSKSLLERQLSNIEKSSASEVVVYYDPANPAKSFLVKPSTTGKVLTVLLAFAPIIIYSQIF